MRHIIVERPEPDAAIEAWNHSVAGRTVMLVYPRMYDVGLAREYLMRRSDQLLRAPIFVRSPEMMASMKSISPEVLILVGNLDYHVKRLCIERTRSQVNPQLFHFTGL